MNRRLFISLLAALPAFAARADGVGYGGVHQLAVTAHGVTFRHRHDWDAPRVRPLFLDLAHHERFLSTDNDFSFVEVVDGDRLVFRSPSPALTHLWISPDAQFFVGLSDVKLFNPYQLVVWRVDGSVMHREHISAEVARLSAGQRRDFAARFPAAEQLLSGRFFTHSNALYVDFAILGVPNVIGEGAWDSLSPLRVKHPYSDDFSESVTNRVWWFDAEQPELGIDADGAGLQLTLRSPSGKRIAIPLGQ